LESRDPSKRLLVGAFFRALRQIGGRWDSPLRLSKLLVGAAPTPVLETQAGASGFAPRCRFSKAAYWLNSRRASPTISAPAAASFATMRDARARSSVARADCMRRRSRRSTDSTLPTNPFSTSNDRVGKNFPELRSAQAARAEDVQKLARSMARSGSLHLQILLLNDEPIAHNLGCFHRGTYYYLKTRYAAKYRALSPGYVPAPLTIRQAHRAGCDRRGLLRNAVRVGTAMDRDVQVASRAICLPRHPARPNMEYVRSMESLFHVGSRDCPCRPAK